jgi:ABC-type nitrate/sulfonate/bicarbonate transport system substrate-binding protein
MLPSALLTGSIDVYVSLGPTGLGSEAKAAGPVTYRCAVGEYNDVVTMPDGSTARASLRAFLRPGVVAPVGSRVVWKGSDYVVREVVLATSPRGDEYVALTLVGGR